MAPRRGKRAAGPNTSSPSPSMDEREAEEHVAQAVAGIADRDERARVLSDILRAGAASGAERVAAARMLEAMERGGDTSAVRLPLPTNRAEQLQRLTRIMTAAGPELICDAFEIICARVERGRQTAYTNRQEGKNLMLLPHLRDIRERTGATKKEEIRRAKRNTSRQRSVGHPSGASAAQSPGVPELYPSAEFAVPSPGPDDGNGGGDDYPDSTPGGEE